MTQESPVMVVCPRRQCCINPEFTIVATEEKTMSHNSAADQRSNHRCRLRRHKLLVDANSRINPTGVTAIENNRRRCYRGVVDCETPAKLAEMLVEPEASALAIPAAVMVAAAVEDELQVTSVVKSALLPSL